MIIRNVISRRLVKRLFDGYSKYIFYEEGDDSFHTYDSTDVVDDMIIQHIKRKTPSP